MSSSSEHEPPEEKEVTKLVTIPQIPDLMEAAGMKRVSQARLRQLSQEPGWPKPVFEGGPRTRVYEWPAILAFMRDRRPRPGYRTDIHGPADQAPDTATGDTNPE